MKNKLNFRKLLFEYKWKITIILILVIIFAGFEAVVPYSFSFIIDNALLAKNMELLIIILAVLAIGAVITAVSQVYRDYIYLDFCSNILSKIRHKTFKHLQNLSMDFYVKNQPGDIIARFSTDLTSFEQALVFMPNYFLVPFLNIIINTLLLFVIDIKLALISLLIFPASLLGPYILTPRASKAGNIRKKTEANTLSDVQTSVTSQSVIKALNLQGLEIDYFNKTNQRFNKTMFKALFLSSLVDRAGIAAVLILQIIVLAVGCFMTFYGTLPVGQLVAFQGLFMGLSYSIISASAFVPMIIQGKVSIQRVNSLLEEEPKVMDNPAAEILPVFKNDIKFNNVTFGYTDNINNLENVSFSIKKNSSVAFVGPSGCGKSTILNLIMRFYDPQKGIVAIDGHDVKKVTQHSLREKLGIVLQENILFNIPIMHNLLIANQNASKEDVYDAARQAEIHDFIMSLPNKYNTLAGERGSQLSGGQRQRLAIARSLLRGGDILILDEATSALDPVSEAAINKTLEKIVQTGKTIISVTHRLSSAVNMDKIFVMENGKIIEQGSHKELLVLKRKYKEMWNKQNN
ncbi:MAG TPA: ABC transporter ATP-binding protein [Victivallales bacterium]|nr:ABC transporter ATP-binding protein [Victivallales bacterium]